MEMTNNKPSLYAQKLEHALAFTLRRLLERETALGKTVVRGGADGKVRVEPAREVLEEVKMSVWWKNHFEE